MSHPDPSHDPENTRITDDPGSPIRGSKSPKDKSIARKRKKVAMSMRGIYPGWYEDGLAKLKKAAGKLTPKK